MSATDRLTAERAFHDAQARQRAASFVDSDALRFRVDDYLDHETWIRPALRQLGDLPGRKVLDFGCGHGMASVVLSRLGASVTAFDLSPGYVDEARRRAAGNQVEVDFAVADAERLPFADASFDCVWGNAVLHHLDLERTSRELCRILQPGGTAVFCEPWGENRLLDWARRRLPYPGKQRTVDEQPLGSSALPILRRFFTQVDVEAHQLLSMIGRLVGRNPVSRGLAWCDRHLLRLAPGLAKYCRYVVLTLKTAGHGVGSTGSWS